MSDIVIRVENLSKKYTLGQKRNEADSGLRHALQHAATAPWRMLKNRKPKAHNGVSAFKFPLSALAPDAPPQSSTLDSQLSTSEASSSSDFWALKDVSFEVRKGEVLGIIGRNGAGKSTLLKILSRITEPTKGQIGIKGRVASLLEVGTGFHHELTGRENIFLNGAILGMSRSEVKRKFDEIVAFAEVDKFLDTPVKRYSSGMYVRLAFAVAAHLEPEILIVDEVLAVGDAEFQKKCLGKIQDVSKGGRTVLFVSHNMVAVRQLCSIGIVLETGHLTFSGIADSAIQSYSGSVNGANDVAFSPKNNKPSITGININPHILAAGNLHIEISFHSPFPLSPPIPGILITSSSGTPVFGSNPRFHREGFNERSVSTGVACFVAENLPLYSGTYRLSVWLGDFHADYDQKIDALEFEFRSNSGDVLRPRSEVIGHVDWSGRWSII